MKTQEEIISRIQNIKKSDMFGFETNGLLEKLTFENAKPYLKEGTTKEEWTTEEINRETILKEMLDYMPFAWEKAKGFRGLSAGRSMAHYKIWVWLIGDDLGDLQNYQFYGKDNLVKICEHYGWDHAQWDDGIRSITEI